MILCALLYHNVPMYGPVACVIHMTRSPGVSSELNKMLQ